MRLENGQKVLYVHLQKALYGIIWASLLLYQKTLKYMDSQGLEINLYDSCVVNNTMNRNHMTIIYHMGYFKIFHMESKEATQINECMKIVYGKDMQVSQRKKHKYLVMALNSSIPG